MSDRLRIAVVGSGVAGLTAAYLLRRRHDVVLFERDDRLGGHANTVSVRTADGRDLQLDTGFIVHNESTYPNLLRLFAELDVETQASDMSFAVSCAGCGLEYAGARGFAGVLAQPANVLRPRFVRMLVEVKRFHRHARRVLADDGADALTLGGFLDVGRYSRYFADHFMLPLTACVWSSSPTLARAYPARYLFRFLANHGMLSISGSPAWRTVTGGSRVYVERVAERLADVRCSTPVVAITRQAGGVSVRAAGGIEEVVDRVVIATHPDQALGLLADPTADERRILGAFAYARNQTLLHSDGSLLPRAARARASWNYRLDRCSTSAPHVAATYHLNRLLALDEPVDYCVSLNRDADVAAGSELRRIVYDHPVYTVESLAAQRQLPSLATDRTIYCGAYHGWGFHEDGCRSGVEAARALGAGW